MREFSTQVSEAILNGLKPNESIRDTMFFEDLYNLVPHEISLRSYEPVTLAISEKLLSYPFPQWFSFMKEDILVTKDKIFSLDTSYVPFDSGHIQTSEWGLNIFSQIFQAIDYEDNWLLVNKDGAIYKKDNSIGSTTKLQANSITKYKNRTVIGGPQNGLWTKEWLAKLEVIFNRADVPEDLFSIPLGKNFIFWSDFGSVHFPFSFISTSDHLNSQAFYEVLLQNTFGFMEMPFKGEVLSLHVLGDQLIVFGEDGICSLAQSEAAGATLSITGQQSIGIRERGAVGGDTESIIFIDRFNRLWKIGPQGLQRLDFQKYLSELTGQIIITKDPSDELFYITDGIKSFVLKNNNLTRVFQGVTKVDNFYEEPLGIVFSLGSEKARFKTDKIDIGRPSNKTLTGVFVSANRALDGNAKAHASVGHKDVSCPSFNLNPEGYAATRLHGKNHSIEVNFNDYRDLVIDRIELKWQSDDNRHTRGILTTEDATGTGE